MGADDISLSRYSDACQAIAADYVERATRFSVKDMRVLEARSVVREFLVVVHHELSVVSDEQDLHGMHTPGQMDFGTADWSWYQEQARSQAVAELARPQTMEGLVRTVKAESYAAISARTRIRTHPRRLFHTYTCSGCHGAGKVACHGCSGSGQVSCSGCFGSGRTSCFSCGGSGTTMETRQVTDYNGYTRTETQHRSCSSCFGGRVTCMHCGGSGHNRCGTCGGSGRVTCNGCSGHGSLTKITTTHTYTTPAFKGRYPAGTPDYVHAALSKVGFAHLASHGRIALQSVDVIAEKSAASFVYTCAIPFCELSADVMGVRSEWVLFGEQPQVFDAGGVLEALLQNDFDRLAAVARGVSRWLPWFHRSARKVVAPLMESELNQQVIDASIEGLMPVAIVERVNRAVSEDYVRHTLLHLERTVRATTHWSRVKWLVFVTLLSLPFSVAAVAWLHHARPLQLWAPEMQLFVYPTAISRFMWEMAITTPPFAALGWIVGRWVGSRWVKRAGGERTLVWARQRGLLMGKWTIVTMVLAAFGASGAFFQRWPLWLDAAGRAYGMVKLFPAPQIIEPVAPVIKAVEKKRTATKKKSAPPRKPAPDAASPAPPPSDQPPEQTEGFKPAEQYTAPPDGL